MAIYPLALLDVNKSADKTIIENSLRRIEEKGTMAWCGYSFSWMASLYARAYKADSAVKQLQVFASNFCSPNSFHLNGDQKGGQYSSFTYRPFTLEGNFAFAQGVHELLLQSRNGYIQVFPSVPGSWQDVSFENLRTEGAFLVSASKKAGEFAEVTIKAGKGGMVRIKLPFNAFQLSDRTKKHAVKEGIVEFNMARGEVIVLRPA
jgi:alpha-L-fucosidase 2